MKKLNIIETRSWVPFLRLFDRLLIDWIGLGLVFLFIVYSFGNITYFVINNQFLWSPLESLTSPIYGPFELADKKPVPYRYNEVSESFGRFELWRIEEIERAQFRDMLLLSTPRFLRARMNLYLDMGLKMAEKYQVDPFWVMAVMWTESHFKTEARSSVSATGLMQIMPGTGHFLSHKLGRPVSPKLAYRLVKEPIINIEMGVYYLDYLLKSFKGSYRLATVAYNMGPAGVRRRIRLGLPTGVRNLYLDKVRRAYSHLTRKYRIYLATSTPAFEKTYVVSPRRIQMKQDWEFLMVLDHRPVKIEYAVLSTDGHAGGKSVLL